MKYGFLLLLLIGVQAWGQPEGHDTYTPESLAQHLTQSLTTDRQKAEAIYGWIANNIAYNTHIYQPRKSFADNRFDPADTMAVWASAEEMTARRVLHRRQAVCDGYAKLFKTLCDYAGLEAVIVTGFARGYAVRNFRTNHTWNAVRIDSAWHLVDVTWGSGYVAWTGEFVQQQNNAYFLTPPAQFIQDHYPEDLRWTLLPNPPFLAEFKGSPFRTKNFARYNVVAYAPGSGVLEASVGDTLQFSLQISSGKETHTIGSDPATDTTLFAHWPGAVFLQPRLLTQNTAVYTYVVDGTADGLYLLFNNDVVLNYRLKRKEYTGRR